MKLFRARAWRSGSAAFDALDSSGSVSGPRGWRFNDLSMEILYAAEAEALAILEVAVRPGFESIQEVLVATIEVADGGVVDPLDLGITLPSNWNAQPVADDSRWVAREFLDAVQALPRTAPRPFGLRVPSVLSSSDCNVLLDPSRRTEYSARMISRVPFKTLRNTRS